MAEDEGEEKVEGAAPKAPAEPVSPVKEWAAAAAIMLVFGLLIFAFVSFFRQ